MYEQIRHLFNRIELHNNLLHHKDYMSTARRQKRAKKWAGIEGLLDERSEYEMSEIDKMKGE